MTSTRIDRKLLIAFVSWVNDALNGRVVNWDPNLLAEWAARFRLHCQQLTDESGVVKEQRGWNLRSLSLHPSMPVRYRQLAASLMQMIEPTTADAPWMRMIIGDLGTGKSSLAWGLVMWFTRHGKRAIYRTLQNMIEELSAAEWTAKDRVRNDWRRVELLVIDEVEEGPLSIDRNFEEFKGIIDARYQAHKPTLLLSNLKPEALNDVVGAKALRRLTQDWENPVVECDWGAIRDYLKPSRPPSST